VEKGLRIDSNNTVVKGEASPPPLVKVGYPSYASQFAEVIVDPD